MNIDAKVRKYYIERILEAKSTILIVVFLVAFSFLMLVGVSIANPGVRSTCTVSGKAVTFGYASNGDVVACQSAKFGTINIYPDAVGKYSQGQTIEIIVYERPYWFTNDYKVID